MSVDTSQEQRRAAERPASRLEENAAAFESSAGTPKIPSELRERLALLVGAERLELWLQRPNQGFAGRTPLELIERGESELLEQMIDLVESGTPR